MNPVAEWFTAIGTTLMAFFSFCTVYYLAVGDPRRKGLPRLLVNGRIEGSKALVGLKCLGGTPVELLGAHVVVETRCGRYRALDHISQSPRQLCPRGTYPPDFERLEFPLGSAPSPDAPLFLQLELGYSDAPYGYVVCRYPFRFEDGQWILAAHPFRRYCSVDRAPDLKVLWLVYMAGCLFRRLLAWARDSGSDER